MLYTSIAYIYYFNALKYLLMVARNACKFQWTVVSKRCKTTYCSVIYVITKCRYRKVVPNSQLYPACCLAQWQAYPQSHQYVVPSLIHVALFLHGFDEHGVETKVQNRNFKGNINIELNCNAKG